MMAPSKKLRDFDKNFGTFLKDLLQYDTHAKFRIQGLIGSEFMVGRRFAHPLPSPSLFNVKKAQAGQCFTIFLNMFLNIKSKHTTKGAIAQIEKKRDKITFESISLENSNEKRNKY